MARNYDAFWQWFADNQASCLQLLTTGANNPAFSEEFGMIFHEYCGEGLYPHLEWPNKDQLPRFIISTHGNYNYFGQVEALVAAAPLSLPWEVMAFEPPRAANYLIRERFPRLAFDVSELCFLPLELYKDLTGPPALTIYIDTERRLSKTHYRAVEQVVYNLLGEKSCILNLSSITLVPAFQLTEEQEEEIGLIELLPEFIVDLSPPAFGVDEEGRLSELSEP